MQICRSVCVLKFHTFRATFSQLLTSPQVERYDFTASVRNRNCLYFASERWTFVDQNRTLNLFDKDIYILYVDFKRLSRASQASGHIFREACISKRNIISTIDMPVTSRFTRGWRQKQRRNIFPPERSFDFTRRDALGVSPNILTASSFYHIMFISTITGSIVGT